MRLARSDYLGQVRSAWPSQVSSVGLDNLEGHNFLVRTPFRVFLDSMESPLSQDSSYVPVEGSR